MVIERCGEDYCLYTQDKTQILFRNPSREAVEERERQINYFKHQEKASEDQDVVEFYTLPDPESKEEAMILSGFEFEEWPDSIQNLEKYLENEGFLSDEAKDYADIDSLPPQIQKLPIKAQKIWRNKHDRGWDGDVTAANKRAWRFVKRYYKKTDKGWRSKAGLAATQRQKDRWRRDELGQREALEEWRQRHDARKEDLTSDEWKEANNHGVLARFVGVTNTESNKHRFPDEILQMMVDEASDRFVLPEHPASLDEIELGALSKNPKRPPAPLVDWHETKSQGDKFGKVLSVAVKDGVITDNGTVVPLDYENKDLARKNGAVKYHDVFVYGWPGTNFPNLVKNGMARYFSIYARHKAKNEKGVQVSTKAVLEHYGVVDRPADPYAQLIDWKIVDADVLAKSADGFADGLDEYVDKSLNSPISVTQVPSEGGSRESEESQVSTEQKEQRTMPDDEKKQETCPEGQVWDGDKCVPKPEEEKQESPPEEEEKPEDEEEEKESPSGKDATTQKDEKIAALNGLVKSLTDTVKSLTTKVESLEKGAAEQKERAETKAVRAEVDNLLTIGKASPSMVDGLTAVMKSMSQEDRKTLCNTLPELDLYKEAGVVADADMAPVQKAADETGIGHLMPPKEGAT